MRPNTGRRPQRASAGGQLGPLRLPNGSGRYFRAAINAAEERHVLLTTEKISALVDNIRGKENRIIEGKVAKRDDNDD